VKDIILIKNALEIW